MQVLQYHDCYEVYLMTHGERYLFFNGECFLLKPGDLYILMPYEMHYTQSMDSSSYGRHLLNFSENQLDKILTPSERNLITDKLKSCVLHLNDEQYHKALFFFQEISEDYSSGGYLSGKLQCCYLVPLLIFLAKCIAETESIPDSTLLPDIKPEISQAIQYINRHFQENITLDFIADHVHLSKYYFCRQFSKAVGYTFLEYLNNVRLAKVHQLLLESNLSITKIAAQTGFSSSVQLSRAFHSVYNMSPSQFRKMRG